MSKFHSDAAIDAGVNHLLNDIRKKKVREAYSYTTSTTDKRYKSGERCETHSVEAKYAERTFSERKEYIKQLIKDISNNQNLSMYDGHVYLRFFLCVRNPILRHKGLHAIKNRLKKNFGDIPSKKEELKEFMWEYYYIGKLLGWIVPIYAFFTVKDSNSMYKIING